MEFYLPYEKKLTFVFQEALLIVDKYPAAYIKVAKDIINSQNPLHNKQVNYISFLLPYWIQDEFKLEDYVVNELVKANIFKVVCAGIQDKVIDSKLPTKYSKLIPLSNLFFIEFYNSYQGLFNSDNKFWDHLNHYFFDYSRASIYEDQVIQDLEIDLLNMDRKILADKAAPIKQVIVAACYLTGRVNEIDQLNETFDRLLITLQLLDDWVDKYKDWEDGCLTPILNEMLQFNQVDCLINLKKEQISRAAYFSDILKKVQVIAESNTRYINEHGISNFPEAEDFHKYLCQDIANICEDNDNQRDKILMGGFHNVLESSINKKIT